MFTISFILFGKLFSQSLTHSIPSKQDNLASKSFECKKGQLPFPVDSFLSIEGNEDNFTRPVPFGCSPEKSLIVHCYPNTSVKSICDCTVIAITKIGIVDCLICQTGNYFITYSNLTAVSVQKNQQLCAGEKMANVYVDDDLNSLEILISNTYDNFLDPYYWFKITASSNQKK
jgi:hypothetical protein